MGLFDKLFGKKKPAVSESSKAFTIDIREDGFVINGKRMDVPIHIMALSEVLGKPRRTGFKTSEEDKEIYAKMHPGEILVQRVNYTWDDLGLMCYTNNGSVVNCFGICLNPTDYNVDSNPKSMFGGTVLINGRPWLGVMMAGKDCDVFRNIIVGSYSLTAEYTDFDQDDSTRDESSFTGIEIQLNDGAEL
ncbi:MAG: hypothetical protein K2N56_11490 [Oscillospiraceae bacterium]|nr:hypothetical protein [Oscillospiraceae bacterium]